ncbi:MULTISPECIES: hypothetical protein [unclassified Mesorhizobium]|nr:MULTISPECIES: hypothetical protein [unclassified Mesorhizobium]
MGGRPVHSCEITIWLSVIAINLVAVPLVLLGTRRHEASGVAANA